MNPLEQRLRDRQPFGMREFMQAALFDPQHGYYSKHIKTVGRRGDFSTSATLDTGLGTAIAAIIRAREHRKVIEIGAGDGSLCQQILQAVGWRQRRKLAYHIVDASSPLISQQRETLGKHAKRVHWQPDMAHALQACEGNAFIFSNELVDAFPATLLEWNAPDSRWHEVQFHSRNEGGWAAGRGPVVRADASPLLEQTSFADQQRIERHDSYIEWLADWLPHWHSGQMITIDYGDLFPAVYYRRPRGTLRAYFAQQRFESLEEVLARPGRQDITADVDFSDLEQRSNALGLDTVSHQTQADWLREQGVTTGIAADPMGAGGAFRVLVQQRHAR